MARIVNETVTCDICKAPVEGEAVTFVIRPDTEGVKPYRLDTHVECFSKLTEGARELKRGRQAGSGSANGEAKKPGRKKKNVSDIPGAVVVSDGTEPQPEPVPAQ